MQPTAPGQFPPPQMPAPTPGGPASIDYLNQISAPVTQKTVNPMVLWAMIGGFLVLLGAVVFFALNSGGPSYTEKLASFAQRVDTLKALCEASKTKIQSSSLRSANSALSLTLTNISRDSATLVSPAEKKQMTKPSKNSPITKEFAKVDEQLENARLNNAFDRTYASEVGYQVAQLRTESKALGKLGNSKKLKEYLTTTEANLAPIAEQFGAFNES